MEPFEDFLDRQYRRVKEQFTQSVRRVKRERRERQQPVLADMDCATKLGSILSAGYSGRRLPSLSEREGDRS